MRWRLGLDIGTNSIGWAALSLDEHGAPQPGPLLGSGVRVFPDGRNPKKQSLAAQRRGPRSMRKRRDRYLKRRGTFMEQLIAHGLMPAGETERKALEKEDPWALRVRGLDEELTLHELGRALFHLQQRRGFKSNRKTDKAEKDDKGKIKQAAKAVEEAMAAKGARTLGELLARPRIDDPLARHTNLVRARLKGSGAQAFYDFYPTRALIEQEFDCLWNAQKEFPGARLSDAAYKDLKDTLLFQRDLKPQPVGKCALIPTEQRAPRALPSVQRFRIYQEINHLTVRLPREAERKLTLEDRDRLVKKFLGSGQVKFDAMRKELKLPDECRFNLESLKRQHLDGDKTAAILALEGKKNTRWGKTWRDLPEQQQDAIVEILLGQERGGLHFDATAKSIAAALDIPEERAAELLETTSEDVLVQWLVSDFGLSQDRAIAVVNAPLPDGPANLGRTAIGEVLEWLSSDKPEAVNPETGEVYTAPFTYDRAARLAGYHHSDLDREKGGYGLLPYYGEVLERHVAFGTGEPTDIIEKRIGKIANPTVHVALNQVRHVVNKLIERYGPPLQIVVELARDLPLSAEGKRELESDQKKNQDANDERRQELAKQGVADTYENRLKLRLWKELNPDNPLDRKCPYSGKQIGIETLLSSEIDIDHILPFSRTLDDSVANKTVCFRQANRDKANDTPYKAFSSTRGDYDWEWISEHAVNMLSNKSWRFGPDAMERYENEEQDFLARQLNETRYIARLAKTYLECVGADVWVTPGRLTADLRWTWGLDSILPGHNVEQSEFRAKNRNDHRNHAIDAIVVGLTDRGLLNQVAKNAGRAEQEFTDRLFADLPDPWPHFRDTVRMSIGAIVVSHKPDHGVEGALHNDMAYGLITEPDAKGKRKVVHRVPLSSLSKPNDLEAVRDPVIREHLKSETEGLTGKDFIDALVAAGESMWPPVRRVRIVETLSVIPICDKQGHAYKGYKGDSNYCYDIFAGANGKWAGEVVSTFDANQKTFNPKSRTARNGSPLIMRLRRDDMLAIDEDGQTKVVKVVKISPGKITFVEHFEANEDKRHRDKQDDFSMTTRGPSALQKLYARLVHVDPAGGMRDPGPPQ